MGQHHMLPLIEIDDTTGVGIADLDFDLIEDGGAQAGDVIEYFIFNMDQGTGGGNFRVRYEMDSPGTFGTSNGIIVIADGSGSGETLHPGNTNTSLAGSQILGRSNHQACVKPVIVPNWHVVTAWDGPLVGDSVQKIWVQTSRPFGTAQGGGKWQVQPFVEAFNGVTVAAGSSVDLADLGLLPGDVILYVFTQVNISGGTWSLALQVLEPGTSTYHTYQVHTTGSSAVNPLPSSVTDDNVNKAFIPGHTSVGVVPIVVVPDMRLTVTSTSDTVETEVGLYYARPFG